MKHYFYEQAGERCGPYLGQQIHAMILAGTIRADARISGDGRGSGSTVADFLEARSKGISAGAGGAGLRLAGVDMSIKELARLFLKCALASIPGFMVMMVLYIIMAIVVASTVLPPAVK